MTYYTTSACIDEVNQMCVDICPVDCIHVEDGVDRMVFNHLLPERLRYIVFGYAVK